MALYDYQCMNPNCNKVEEISHPINSDETQFCSTCRTEMKKIISSTSFKLKGEGWYKAGFHAR